ncbi:MAG: DegV family protein [Clostridia bacterium]|nr:DegV family protein [Clostridia bacterium]
MENKVMLFADSSIDLSAELRERYDIHTVPIHVILDDKVYEDGVDITTQQIFDHYRETKQLPKTAAINVNDIVTALKPYVDDGYEIVYISLGSALSSSYRNSCLASEELDGKVYPVDSCSLSTGAGLLAIEAAERIAQGMPAKQVAEEVSALNQKNHASFVLDTLEFLRAGGRCSALAAFGANLLGLKPSIKVFNDQNGAMGVGKKYRGKFEKIVFNYIDDTLAEYENIKTDRAFVTFSTMDNDLEKKAYEYLESKGIFKEIFITTASGTISSHCGPNTIGILFMTN